MRPMLGCTEHSRECHFGLENRLKFSQKPFVDISHLPDFVNGVSPMEGRGNGEHAFIGGILQLFVDVFHEVVLISRRYERTAAS